MTPIEKLLSKSKQGKKELARQDLIVSVTEQIWAALEAAQMNKADLARALETSKANVTQLLAGQRNMTLATLADIGAAIGVKPSVHFSSQILTENIQLFAKTSATPVRVVGDYQAITEEITEPYCYKIPEDSGFATKEFVATTSFHG